LAVAISQAPGVVGQAVARPVLERGHQASCASSSARPTSRTRRATPATMRADSSRQTASTGGVAALGALAGGSTINSMYDISTHPRLDMELRIVLARWRNCTRSDGGPRRRVGVIH
jgi:hypothetical protein